MHHATSSLPCILAVVSGDAFVVRVPDDLVFCGPWNELTQSPIGRGVAFAHTGVASI